MEAHGRQLMTVPMTAKSYVLQNHVQRLERTETAWMVLKASQCNQCSSLPSEFNTRSRRNQSQVILLVPANQSQASLQAKDCCSSGKFNMVQNIFFNYLIFQKRSKLSIMSSIFDKQMLLLVSVSITNKSKQKQIILQKS
jgi:hypothetical protein